MKTASVADLRNNFRRLSSWIEHGETVHIVKRGKAFAQLTPITTRNDQSLLKPDFTAQIREIWGERMFSTQEVEAMKADELEGQEW